MQVTNEDVLNTLFSNMNGSERVILCTVAGDPSTVERWPGVPWQLQKRCPLLPSRNNYAAVSSFTAGEGGYRRKKDQFGAMHCIMVDDIGTKVPVEALPSQLRPTLLVETSPGNYQAVFKLEEPIYDINDADALVKQMIAKLVPGGVDPGMMGVTRVFRLPVGINGKPKYWQPSPRVGGPLAEREPVYTRLEYSPPQDSNVFEIWPCRVARWSPDTVMSFNDLAKAFMLVRQVRTFTEPSDAITLDRKRGFEILLSAVKMCGLIKRQGRGWVDIICPWLSEHTDKANTGAAVAYPAKANGFMGGFRCHHGHCAHRNLADLEEWLCERVARRAHSLRKQY